MSQYQIENPQFSAGNILFIDMEKIITINEDRAGEPNAPHHAPESPAFLAGAGEGAGEAYRWALPADQSVNGFHIHMRFEMFRQQIVCPVSFLVTA